MTLEIAEGIGASQRRHGRHTQLATWRRSPRAASPRRWSMRGWVAMAMLVVGLQASPVLAQLSCGTVYTSSLSGQIYSTANNGTQPLVGTVTGLPAGNVNPFGIAPGGGAAYLVGSGTGRVSIVNTTTFAATSPALAPTLPGMPGFSSFNAGAVNPVDGRFYFAGPSTAGWQLFVYNPATPAVVPFRVGIINVPATSTSNNSGDIEFDSRGNLYLLAGNIASGATPTANIYRVGQVPITAGTGLLPATVLVGFSPLRNAGGIAFNAAGELVVSNGGLNANGNAGTDAFYISRYNPTSGAQIGPHATASASVITDLASCAGGNSITLQKSLPGGRVATTDQFRLELSGGGLATTQTAVTNGPATGLQTVAVGPLLAVDNAVFTIDEVGAGTPAATLTNYVRSWQCVDAGNGNASLGAPSTTFPGSITIPANNGINGASVVCTITNAPRPQVTIRKISEGGVGSFSFTGTNGIANQTLTTITAGTAVSGTVQPLTAAGTATTITESAPPAGYALTAASCTGLPTGGTAIPNLATRTLSLNAAATAAGANLVCTFTNTNTLASLSIAKSGSPTTVPTGGLVNYTIAVANNGTIPVTGAQVLDTVPAGLDCTTAPLVAPTCTPAATCTGPLTAAALTTAPGITLGTLATGTSVAITLQCRVTASGQ